MKKQTLSTPILVIRVATVKHDIFKNVDMFETFLSDHNKTLFLFCADMWAGF